jgi:hypothetical protein
MGTQQAILRGVQVRQNLAVPAILDLTRFFEVLGSMATNPAVYKLLLQLEKEVRNLADPLDCRYEETLIILKKLDIERLPSYAGVDI